MKKISETTLRVKSINDFNKSFGINKNQEYDAVLIISEDTLEVSGYYGGTEINKIEIRSLIVNGICHPEEDFIKL